MASVNRNEVRLNNEEKKQLCLALMHSESEAEVIKNLNSFGMWDQTEAWRWLGDEEFNYSSVGNQQSKPEQAIVEKLVNSIDAKLICQARLERHLPLENSSCQHEDTPKTVREAQERYFGKFIDHDNDISRSITVAATANGIPSKGFDRPCFTIADNGEGQTPTQMPNTILSLHKGNKDRIKFAQGKFNMGGTGVLEFCGLDSNLQLVISKRHPDLIFNSAKSSDRDWSFTIIRRETPIDGKISRFSYLAPSKCNKSPNQGNLIHFSSNNLPIFPEGNKAYARDSNWGTLIKLFEYDARKIKGPITLQGGLMYRARLLLPEPALPIRFYECRPFGTKKGSNDATMPGIIKTLKNDYHEKNRNNVEWFDKLEFVENGEKYSAELYLFKDQDAANQYKSDEGILFLYNGQCHASITKDFFRRKNVGLEYLRHSLLMFVDCSNIKQRTHEQLFMNSRDRLREGEIKSRLEDILQKELYNHSELKRIASERRRKTLSKDSNVSETMPQVIENLLTKNPTLANLLQQGSRIRNPHKPEFIGKGVVRFKGKRFPTKFYFKGKNPNITFHRDAYLGSNINLEFETDAENDYFKRDEEPGKLTVFKDEIELINYKKIPRLFDGIAKLILELPVNVGVGEDLNYTIEITDPSRPEPFICKLKINVKPAKPNSSGPNSGSPGGAGSGKGPTGSGNKLSTDTHLDFPEPHPVYEVDWDNHQPNFDRHTAIRINDHPDAKPEEERYDFFINMDNIYLQTYMKEKPKEASNLKLKYSVGMTLIALSILHQNLLIKKGNFKNLPSIETDVRDQVAITTSGIAPFLLPMIDDVSLLDSKDEE